MPNNTEVYCPNCREVTLHFAETGGWRCDECDCFSDNVYQSPYKEDY